MAVRCRCLATVPDEFPVGLMVWSGALADDRVLNIGLAIEAALRPARAR